MQAGDAEPLLSVMTGSACGAAQACLLSGALRRKAAASLPAHYLLEGRRLWLDALDTDAEPNSALVDVSEALARIGLEHERAPIVGKGTFKMDILLRQLDKDGHPVRFSCPCVVESRLWRTYISLLGSLASYDTTPENQGFLLQHRQEPSELSCIVRGAEQCHVFT